MRKGEYEELRNSKNLRQVVVKDLNRTKNQVHNWLDRYFPEYKEAYVGWESKSLRNISASLPMTERQQSKMRGR